MCRTNIGYYKNRYIGPTAIEVTEEAIEKWRMSVFLMMFLGLEHEHTRFDRDDYVKMDFGNARFEFLSMLAKVGKYSKKLNNIRNG